MKVNLSRYIFMLEAAKVYDQILLNRSNCDPILRNNQTDFRTGSYIEQNHRRQQNS